MPHGWLSPEGFTIPFCNNTKKHRFIKSETPVACMPIAFFYRSVSTNTPFSHHQTRQINILVLGTAAVTLLSNGKLDTLALGQRDPGLLVTNDENIALTGGEGVVNSVLDVDNVETTIVALTVSDDTNTTHVTTTNGHGDGASVELDEVGDLASGEVNLDGVVDLDGRVRVTDAMEKD